MEVLEKSAVKLDLLEKLRINETIMAQLARQVLSDKRD
jgi:hypothetical protein